MRIRSLAVLGVCLAALTGCGDQANDVAGTDAPTESASSSGSPTASPSESAGAGRVYVALGDSFTAAPLVPDTDPNDACLRSSANYPALVAAAVGDLDLTDVSCTGADSTSLVGVQTIGSQFAAPQFNALSADTDLVTVGMGGNDFGLYSSLLADCASSSDVGADGRPCTDAVSSGTTQDLTAILPQLEKRIEAVITGIGDRAPHAQVIVVGYPRFLPDSGTCNALAVAAGDLPYVRRLDQGLSSAVKAAAAATDTTYINVYAASKGHDICSDDPWVNGNATQTDKALAFHPFAAEQQAVADLVVAAVEPDGSAAAS